MSQILQGHTLLSRRLARFILSHGLALQKGRDQSILSKMLISIFNFRVWFLLLACHLVLCASSAAASIVDRGRASVVKIYVTSQRNNVSVPWQGNRPDKGYGSGFIIKGRRILTNAHLVGDARFLQVQKDAMSGRFQARVLFVAHDCDLAMLEVIDPRFFDGTNPLPLAAAMPKLNDEVIVLGYPVGGERLSVTKGVVSRLSYAGYTHSGVDQHLALQVDAAINPGNSGGPVMLNGRVVGVAFQGLAWADGIGFAIPLPVIRHFLDDVKDGNYHGYPELGVAYIGLRNPAMRKNLQVPADKTGVVIYYLDPYGSALQRTEPGDVILSIDGYEIDNDGTVMMDNERLLFSEILERKQWGESISLSVWRDAKTISLKIPLKNPTDPFLYRNSYGVPPKYYVHGGLVFSPMSREYVRTLRRNDASKNVQLLHYLFEYSKIDGHNKDRNEFVILIERLAHPVNTYMQHFVNGVVETVNDKPIPNLEALRDALKEPKDGFFVVTFMGMEDILVLDASASAEADEQIMSTYGLPRQQYMGEAP